MASIRKLPSGKWNVQVRGNGKLYASGTFATRKRAEAFADAKEKAQGQDHPLFLDAGHNYCHTVLANKPSQYLAGNRLDRICRFDRLAKPINEITLQDVHAYKQHRLIDASPTTCRDELMMIRRVFRWYIRELMASTGVTMANPCDLLTIPRANKPRDRVVTAEELALLMDAMSPIMATIVELAFETAMRRSEILKLTPYDLHLENRYLCVVEGKEGSRDVPLTSRAVELLRGALGGVDDPDTRLFPVAGYSVTQAVRRAREALGLSSEIRFHQLRHTRITEVARMGLNQAQIMIVSGHRDIRSVQRYTHLNVRDVIDLLD